LHYIITFTLTGTWGENSINKNRTFYVTWLLPKLREFGKHKGWILNDILLLGEDGIMSEPQPQTQLQLQSATENESAPSTVFSDMKI